MIIFKVLKEHILDIDDIEDLMSHLEIKVKMCYRLFSRIYFSSIPYSKSTLSMSELTIVQYHGSIHWLRQSFCLPKFVFGYKLSYEIGVLQGPAIDSFSD
jgi:hypothetical protein